MPDGEINKRKTIIVVDDEPIIRMDLSQMLEELNYEVVAVGADGFDAVELCREKHPDIILLDLEMPIFDGMTAAETIINENLACCVVICTAFADDDFLERAGRAGVSGYIVKPIEERNLRPTIEMAYAQGKRFAKAELDLEKANQRLEESRIIERAKGVLAKSDGISETDAYRKMQKAAMEKRTALISVARAVLKSHEQSDITNKAKKLLMQKKGFTEQDAYSYLVKGSKKAGVTISVYCESLLKEMV